MSESIRLTPEERQAIINEIIANLVKLGFVEHETESNEDKVVTKMTTKDEG